MFVGCPRRRSRPLSSISCARSCVSRRSSSGLWRAARVAAPDLTEAEVREALGHLDPLWDELFPAEQARIVQLLVERVDVRMNGAEVRLRPNGLAGLVREVAGNRRAAA